MPLHTTTLERAVHLLLFVAGGAFFALSALAVLERLGGGERKALVSIKWLIGPALAFIVLFVIERIYHATH